ncbi:MAG: hypothetical protein GXO40_02100, partial [Epsilonproteobacteria bacterium]|nr:hypothetical protein [Campylobacterota bacterium]
MNFKISNILSIKEANIVLNGLTVIAGENDSGKSTVGKSVFCLVKNIAMSKGNFFYRNREKFIQNRLDDLKNIAKFLVQNKQEYDNLAREINQFNNNFRSIKTNLDGNKQIYLDELNHLKATMNKVSKSHVIDFEIIFEELSEVVTNEFREKFKKNNMQKLLDLTFDRDFLKHYEHEAFIELQDEIMGKKNEVLLKRDKIEKVYENGKLFYDVTFVDTPVILHLYPLL